MIAFGLTPHSLQNQQPILRIKYTHLTHLSQAILKLTRKLVKLNKW